MPVDAVYPWLLTRVLFVAHAASGATRIRHSLRPLMIEGGSLEQLGQIVPRERGLLSPSAVMLRASGASSTPRLLDFNIGVSGILDRPVKPGDDVGESGGAGESN